MELSMALDVLDYKIIKELHQNARAEATEVARYVDAHERTVRNRIDRLLEKGAIRLATIVNPKTLGYVTSVHLTLEVDPESEEEVVQKLLSMQEVAYIAYGLNDHNILLVQAHFKDNDDMREFLRRTVPLLPGTQIIRSILVARTLRQMDEWMPGSDDFV
jgi:Lrp/AsnC family transcriptional regulator for asnA, asnC and gidA